MCAEVTLCVLDTLEMIIRVVGMAGSDHLLFALPIILREFVSCMLHCFPVIRQMCLLIGLSIILPVQLHLLACNQSVQALDCIFASQRALVVKYPELVFEQVQLSFLTFSVFIVGNHG